jgi:hypothetical protein
MTGKRLKSLKRRASKLPNWAVDVAATKAYPTHKKRQGNAKWGAASPVRHVDPATYEEAKP